MYTAWATWLEIRGVEQGAGVSGLGLQGFGVV